MSYLALTINSKDAEVYFCHKHRQWNYIDNEEDCCTKEELEDYWMEAEKDER